MALRTSSSVERPDHTKEITGGEGDRMAQEPTSGKGIYRKGAATEEADLDIAAANDTLDLTGDDGPYESGQKSTGGAEALAGHIVSDDGNTFDVRIDWMADDGTVLVTEDRAALTNVSDIQFNLVVRSDHFEVRLVDNTGAAQVHGSVNAH